MSHTPGPWRHGPGNLLVVRAEGGHGVAVADVACASTRHPDLPSEANARLIAAAPELLAALEEARNGLGWYRAEFPDASSDADDEALVRIDAAIAEARGGK